MRRTACLLALSLVLACSDEDDGTGAGAGGSTTTASASTTSASGSTSSESATGASATSSGTGGGSGGGSFTLEVHTELDASPGLILRVNLPIDVADCVTLAGDPPCADLDGDGIVDVWEDAALDRLRPIQRFDEDETLVNDDPTAVLADVGRVAPEGDFVHVFIMLGYSKDYGSCGGFTGHNGDSERVALELERLEGEGAGDVRVRQAYTAAHEGTSNDHSQIFTGPDLATLVHDIDPSSGEPRWVVFPSSDKHGTYATIDICEGVSSIPCLDEDCGPDDVGNPAMYDRLPPYVNAGEEAMPLVTDLTAIGFPGDDAWAVQDFCGGLGGSGCSDDVRNKLLPSPF